MTWRTYTPDGRTLEVHVDGKTWVATCGGRRETAASAADAVRKALGVNVSSIGSNKAASEAWITARAAQLERESPGAQARA